VSKSGCMSLVNGIMKLVCRENYPNKEALIDTRQMVRQFFASMKPCIDLVLSGGSSFEFAQMLLKIRSRTSVTLEALRRLGRI